jgi:hypothetical protein
MFYCILNTSNVIVTSFACSQLPTTQPGYAEIPDEDPRVAEWALAQLPNPIPQSVSAFQAKAALLAAGLYSAVNSYMTTTASPFDALAWQESAEFQRQSPTIAALMTAMNLTSAQLDSLFLAAFLITA